jgi:hypothetical protein
METYRVNVRDKKSSETSREKSKKQKKLGNIQEKRKKSIKDGES